MILADDLDQPLLMLRKERKVLDEIQQTLRLTRAAQHYLQRDSTRFVFAFDALPFKAAVPISRERANSAIASVGRNEKSVVPEELRDLLLVVREVVVEGTSRWY